MEEKDLITSCIKGHRAAQSELVRAYAPRLLSLIRRYQPATLGPEDILQEAFIEIFRGLKSYDRDKASLYTWMKTITVRMTLKKYRLTRTWMTEITTALDESADQAYVDQHLDKLETEDLMKFVYGLPDGYREVFNLVAIEGFSHDECARLLQIPAGTSRSCLSRARQLLRNQIIQLKIY